MGYYPFLYASSPALVPPPPGSAATHYLSLFPVIYHRIKPEINAPVKKQKEKGEKMRDSSSWPTRHPFQSQRNQPSSMPLPMPVPKARTFSVRGRRPTVVILAIDIFRSKCSVHCSYIQPSSARRDVSALAGAGAGAAWRSRVVFAMVELRAASVARSHPRFRVAAGGVWRRKRRKNGDVARIRGGLLPQL